jgi:secreted PhoX family phosphatase
MFFSGITGSPAGLRAALFALCVAALLAGCKHKATGDNKGLWIANGTNVVEFVPKQLTMAVQSGAPQRNISSATFGAPQGVTFDSKGNLWVMDPQANINGAMTPALLEFSAMQLSQLAMSNAPEPVAIITSTDLAFPQQSVFDKQGNQWVSDHNNNSILVFTSAQLAMTGTNALMPAVVITSPAFNGPLGIVFDGAGNLWVANNGGVPGANNGPASAGGTSIVEFAAAHLPMVSTTGMLTPQLNPDITLSDDGNGSVQGPWELAFDASGNLWSSNANAPFTLVKFAKANLGASGSPTPAITMSPTTVSGSQTLNDTNGLCFDNAGDIAATNAVDAGSASFYKTPLKTGTLTPSTFIVGTATTLTAPAGCNFGPLIN